MKINKYELFSKVIINILFMSVFIGCFFFTYGAYIEKLVVKNQMEFLCENITRVTSLFGKNANKYLYDTVNNSKLPDLSKEDEEVKKSNRFIIIKVIVLNLIAVMAIGYLIYYTNNKYNNSNEFPLNEVIPEDLIILFVIAIVEFIFLTYFGSRYISINPNNIKQNILKNLISEGLI